MNELLANVFTAMVVDENEENYFVQKNGQTFRLKKEEGNHVLGEAVEGFAYLDQKQKNCFTTQIPEIRRDHFGFGVVTQTRRDLGVFVDIGLSDKDVVVSLDELSEMHELWPKKGDHLMLSLRVDEKNRIWGVLADDLEFEAIRKPATEELNNADLTGVVYRLKLVGTYVLTQDHYLGFIHPSERYKEPRLGETVQARVIGVRPDGILNLSLKPRAYEAIPDDAAMILAYLEREADQSMPYTDKSTPEEIKQKFGISKGQFKRALGHLMKQRLIEQKEGYTRLIGKSN
ncbi:MAG TPA: DNA-binding protein [Candidatus Tetragenococcus pullicola]|nr:DNA-binding protein [Candidatus Tetragenococcus pullicola]